MMAYEQEILKAQDQFEWILDFTTKAAAEGKPMPEVEKHLWESLQTIGLTFLQAHTAAQGDGNLGESIEHQDGRKLKRMEAKNESRYVSVFGDLKLSEYVYAARESQKIEVRPVSARLEWPESEFSPLLEHWAQGLAVHDSFGEAKETIKRILNIGISVSAMENMNRRMAKEVEGFRETVKTPSPEDEGEILVLTADCKGIPMVRDEKVDRPKGTRLGKGEKKNKKKMAAVTAIYSTDRFERTPDDIMSELGDKGKKKDRPKPKNKRVRAEMTSFDDGVESKGKDRALKAAADEIAKRNPGNVKCLTVVMDGEKALWTRVRILFPFAIFVLDIFHVIERLWSAANALYGEETKEAKEFVDKQLRSILEGRVGFVVGALKQIRTKRKLRGGKHRGVDSVITYLSNNRKYMKYDEYLLKGLPIGSGVAEGACRHLVKDRMERTGMRWRVEGAQSMLDVRATYLNGEWESFFDFRLTQNRQRCAEQISIIQAAESQKKAKSA